MTRYSPYTWADNSGGGTPITAARLNALEAGADADVPVADIDATGTASSTTYLRGDGTWATPPGGTPSDASDTVKGIVELATSAETLTGTDTVRATTPAGVKAVADTKAAVSHSHAASDITSGTVATARLGSGTASSSTYLRGDQTWATVTGSGSLSGLTDVTVTSVAANDYLHWDVSTSRWINGQINTSHITAGTMATARLGSGTADNTKYLRGDQVWATIPATPDASDTVKGLVELATTAEATTGTDTARAVTPAGLKTVADTKAALSHTHAATDIASGTVATARLGSGTASSTTYLRGDNTWATPPGGTPSDASDTVKGIVELATDAEAVTGTDTVRAVTPANVAAVVAVTRARYSAVNAQTGTTYAPVLSDEGKLVTLSNASAITVTMPQDSTTAFPVGATIDFVGIGAGLVTFSAGTGATVNPTSVTRAQWSAVTAIKRAANTWLIVGDLA